MLDDRISMSAEKYGYLARSEWEDEMTATGTTILAILIALCAVLCFISSSAFTEPQRILFMAPLAQEDTWTKKADMLCIRYDLSASTVNGKIYAIGGFVPVNNKSVYSSRVDEYDPVADKWTRKTDMPTRRSGLSTCAADGRVYAMGGFLEGQPKEFRLVEEYDPVMDKWTRKADMLTERQHFSANAVGGKIYAIGGWRVAKAISKTEEYDPAADRWIRKADMPTARYGFSASAVNGRIYVVGGCPVGGLPFGGSGVISTVEEYDPVTDTWTKKADMPTARMFLTTSAVGGKIYAIGGMKREGNSIVDFPTVEEYDPLMDKWTKKTDMPTKRSRFASGVVNGRIYVIGAWGFSVEEYNPGFSGQNVKTMGKLPTKWGEIKLD